MTSAINSVGSDPAVDDNVGSDRLARLGPASICLQVPFREHIGRIGTELALYEFPRIFHVIHWASHPTSYGRKAVLADLIQIIPTKVVASG